MKRDQLPKCVGFRVKLQPPSCWLDENGLLLAEKDEDWTVLDVDEQYMRLKNDHDFVAKLAFDNVYSFYEDGTRTGGGARYGLLKLNVQIYLRGNVLSIRATKPGERLLPPDITPGVLQVNTEFPASSGLQAQLESSGFRTHWALAERVAGLVMVDGWEEVLTPDRAGRPCRVVTRDLVYLKKRGRA